MKNRLFFLGILSLTLFFNNCTNNTVETGEGAVNLLCDCFIEAGVENEYDLMDLDHDEKQRKEVIKCVLPILEDVRDELDDMSDEERVEYFGDAIKAAVDCDCGIKLLEVGAKVYDTEDVEDEIDDLIMMIEWAGGYSSSDFFGIGGSSYYDYLYDDIYSTYEDDYDYDYPLEVVEEDCYGDYYLLEMDLIDYFMYNIKNENIVLGETTWSEMYDLTGDGDGFDQEYGGMYVSGYFEYDDEDVLQYISLDYYYECDGVLDYLDSDKSSLTYAIEDALEMEGTYDDSDYYDDDPGVEWDINGMNVRQANFSDGFAFYISYDGYYDEY